MCILVVDRSIRYGFVFFMLGFLMVIGVFDVILVNDVMLMFFVFVNMF